MFCPICRNGLRAINGKCRKCGLPIEPIKLERYYCPVCDYELKHTIARCMCGWWINVERWIFLHEVNTTDEALLELTKAQSEEANDNDL